MLSELFEKVSEWRKNALKITATNFAVFFIEHIMIFCVQIELSDLNDLFLPNSLKKR